MTCQNFLVSSVLGITLLIMALVVMPKERPEHFELGEPLLKYAEQLESQKSVGDSLIETPPSETLL